VKKIFILIIILVLVGIGVYDVQFGRTEQIAERKEEVSEKLSVSTDKELRSIKDKRAVAKEFYRVWLDLEKKMGSELEKLADDERIGKLTTMSTEIVTKKLGISTPVLHKILEQFSMEELTKEIQSE